MLDDFFSLETQFVCLLGRSGYTQFLLSLLLLTASMDRAGPLLKD